MVKLLVFRHGKCWIFKSSSVHQSDSSTIDRVQNFLSPGISRSR
jgi:hypothetical protein